MVESTHMPLRIPLCGMRNLKDRRWRLLSGRRFCFFRTIRALVFALLIMSALNPVTAAGISLKDVLPAQSFSAEWIIEEKVKLFDKDTLFDHINGEAELYFPYGFDSLATANYVNRKDKELSVVADIYKMASVLDAFGIYSNYRKANNTWITIGAEGFVSPSQLMFYQDRYFIRLQVSGGTSISRETFEALARAISGKLPAGSAPPGELDALKIPALVPKSERYLAKSLLGYVFFRRGMIADAAVQDERMQIFAIREDTPAAARKVFDQYGSYLTVEAKDVRLTGNTAHQRVSAVDPLYGGVLAEQSGRYVFGVVRIKNEAGAGKLIEQLRARISAGAN
jgi:acyl-CoA synthetase (AMP-forming)/AMP-acid ligase II